MNRGNEDVRVTTKMYTVGKFKCFVCVFFVYSWLFWLLLLLCTCVVDGKKMNLKTYIHTHREKETDFSACTQNES